MFSSKVTANSDTATPLSASTSYQYGIVSIDNESPSVDAYLLYSATEPSASDVVSGGKMLKHDFGNQTQLQDVNGGEDMNQWWVATAFSTATISVCA